MKESVKHIYKIYAWYNLSEQKICGSSGIFTCFSKYVEAIVKINPLSSENQFIKKYAVRKNNANRK